jgi:hypothetical protein
MANYRIYLGVDIQSNLAVSLEIEGQGSYYLIVSESADGKDLCRFLCSDQDLNGIVENKEFELTSREGHCIVHSTGDDIIFEFQKNGSEEVSTCALSANSFNRVVRLARNRAFVI